MAGDLISNDPQTDAIWILSSGFIVFTMQSGFGLLESGSVSVKNELNIMIKNVVDVLFGGISFWLVGYGFSFGNGSLSNPFIGWGDFCVTAEEDKLGVTYSKFIFQASFATTATTIVSGAMAERTKLPSYMLFSMLNSVLFSVPAHWVWASNGWLHALGLVDIAGAGPVHIVGGFTGLVATLILKPRHGRYVGVVNRPPVMSSPTNAVLGMFMLWWGWLGFNSGSTFGISGDKWNLAARSAATTLSASVAGGISGLALSFIVKDRKFDVTFLINGLLGSLVSVTAVCAIVQPWEGIIIGFVGSVISNGGVALLDKLKVDDPVGCVGTHALSGTWGLIVAGLFVRKNNLMNALSLHKASTGLFYGGGFHQLGIQCLAVVAIAAWTVVVSYIFLKAIDATIGLRISLEEEIIGADIVEHGVGDYEYDRKTNMLILLPKINDLKQNGNAPNGKLRDDQCSPGIINLSEIDLSRLGSVLDRNRSQQSPRLHHHLLGSTARRRTEHEINSELALGKEIGGKADTQRRHQKNGHRSLVSMLNNIKTTVFKWGNGNTRKSVGLRKDTDRNIKISDNSFRQIDLLHSSNGSVCTDDVSVVNVGNHRDMSASMDTICVDINDSGCSDYHDTITIGRRKVTRI